MWRRHGAHRETKPKNGTLRFYMGFLLRRAYQKVVIQSDQSLCAHSLKSRAHSIRRIKKKALIVQRLFKHYAFALILHPTIWIIELDAPRIKNQTCWTVISCSQPKRKLGRCSPLPLLLRLQLRPIHCSPLYSRNRSRAKLASMQTPQKPTRLADQRIIKPRRST